MGHTNSPWVCVTKFCSNGGAIYIIGEIIAGMRLFRFLADFRYFQGKFCHFCESSKSGLKFYRGGGDWSGDLRCQLDNSETTMFVRSTCVFRDVTVDGRNPEQSMTMFTNYRLFH